MKKIAFIMVSLLAAAACNDMIAPENTPSAGENGIEYFVSTMEGNDVEVEEDDTKTALQPSNLYRVFWEETDYISIYDGTTAHQYKATPYADKNGNYTTAHFYPVQTGLVLPAGQKYYALYPYDENAEWNGSKVTFTIPEQQTPVAGNFPYNASVAVSQNNSLKFCNIGALISFKVNTSAVKTVVFKARDGEYLTGTVTMDCSDPDNSEGLSIVEGSSMLRLEGNLTANTTYFVTVLPISKGLDIYLFGDKGYQSVSIPAFDLGRSQRIELGNIFDHTQKQWQGYAKTGSNYSGVQIKVDDTAAPGGFYYPLACGIDVAGEELYYNSAGDKSWNDFCDPNGTLTDEEAKNLTLTGVPKNPCPEGWNLPTKAQLDLLTSEDNIIQYAHTQSCYWKMRSGDFCDQRDLWGSTNMYIISSETNDKGECYRWQFTYTSYKENNVVLYYYLTANIISSQTIDRKDNKYAHFRCVREAQQ